MYSLNPPMSSGNEIIGIPELNPIVIVGDELFAFRRVGIVLLLALLFGLLGFVFGTTLDVFNGG